jgi:hypothetical protein
MYFFTSYKDGTNVSYGAKGNRLEVGGCPATARGQYIMLAMGPDIINLSYQKGNSFTGHFLDDKCVLKDHQLDPSRIVPYQKKLDLYKKQTKLLNTCIEYEVTDKSRRGIHLPPSQPGCTVTKTGPNKAVGQGGYCFFRIQPDSEFEVHYNVRKECADAAFLKSEKLDPMDVNFGIHVYKAGDATGHSTDLTHIDLLDARMTIQPDEKMMPLSTNFGHLAPRWPTTWAPDVHVGHIKIQAGDFPTLDMGLLVDNQCPQKCVDGLCSGPCDYNSAIGTSIQLQGIEDPANPVLYGMWYQAGVAPAQWQGMISGEYQYIGMQPFEVGKRYRLRYNFAYPDTFYRIAKDGFKQFLIRMIHIRAAEVGVSSLPPLNELIGIEALYKKMPGVQPLPSLRYSARDMYTDFGESLATLASYLSFVGWPPYYENLCDPTLQNCGSPFEGTGTTEIDVEFTVAKLSEPNYKLKDIKITRRSPILPDYEITGAKLPSVQCGSPVDPVDPNGDDDDDDDVILWDDDDDDT